MRSIEEINNDIIKTRDLMAIVKKLKNTLEDLYCQQNERREAKNRAAEVMEKENKDVCDFEHVSLKSIIASISGKKFEKLEKERAEALSAKLRYEQAVYDLERITSQITTIKGELSGYGNPEKLLKNLLDEKEEVLKTTGTEQGVRLSDIENKLAVLQASQKEIKEALSAGSGAMSAIDSMDDSLQSASNYGVWDMVGGGLIATAIKHDKLDDAESHAQDVQRHLSRFRTELADVSTSFDNVTVEMSGFLTFADYFFDNIFVDFMVQDKISNAREGLSGTRSKVRNIYNKLTDMEKGLSEQISTLLMERDELLNNMDQHRGW